jgi:hypothetical protein
MALIGSIIFLSKKKALNQAILMILGAFVCYLLLLGPVGAARYLLPWYSIISILIGLNVVEFSRMLIRYENTSTK